MAAPGPVASDHRSFTMLRLPPLAVKTSIFENGGGVVGPDLGGPVVRYYSTTMSDVISDYQRWKQQGDDLRLKAKQAMESRFRELLTEAATIAEEYRSDFGLALKPPAAVTAFRFKAHGKAKAKKATPPKPGSGQKPSPPPEQKPSPKVAGLQKRLATAKAKLDETKAAGKPTRLFEDKIYEIEDELRLAVSLP
jgi:hypothetical protein